MNEQELNENDKRLLAYCYGERKFVSDIARNIGIDVKNVSVRVEKLYKAGLIDVEMIGNKKFIRTKDGSQIKKYMLEILKILKDKKEMSPLEFQQIYSFWNLINDPQAKDKKDALSYVEFGSPPLIQKVIKLTPEGEKFLND